MSELIRAPWTPEQVYNLNKFQENGRMHPFTCGSGNRTEASHSRSDGVLVATINGWICPYCEYKQDWAHEFMGASHERD